MPSDFLSTIDGIAELDVARRAARAIVPADGVRFDRDGERPLGPKGRRTRDAILTAAHDLLVEDGWQATTTTAIAASAGIGAGTMYQYFRSKQAVVAAIVGQRALTTLDELRDWDPNDGRPGLRDMLARFVFGYASSTGFQRVWEEVSLVDEEMAALRRDLTEIYVQLIARAFDAGSQAGILDVGPNSTETARALCAMADRYCHQTFNGDDAGRRVPDADEVVTTLCDLWARAISLD